MSKRSGKSKGDEVIESGGGVTVKITRAGTKEQEHVQSEQILPVDKTIPGRTCKSCKGRDSNAMVQCDTCDKWYHFKCVGVTSEVEKHPWSCPKCVSAKWAQREDSVSGKDTPSPRDTNIHTEQQITTAVENPTPKEQAVPSSLPEQGECSHTPKAVVDNPVSKPKKTPTVVSDESKRSTRSLLKLQLLKLEEERKMNREYLDRKYDLLEEIAAASSSTSSVASGRIRDWIKDTNNHQEETKQGLNVPEPFKPPLNSTGFNPKIPPLNPGPPPVNVRPANQNPTGLNPQAPVFGPQGNVSAQHQQPDHLRPAMHNPPNRTGTRLNLQMPAPWQQGPIPVQHQQPEPIAGHPHVVPQTERIFDPCPFTGKQLAARQAISRDLPIFSGDPEEWPIFLSTFTSTTVMCGFTNEENVIRLQKSLKGRAYEAVKSRLLHPSNVPGVIETLRMLFGQPEAIVHSLTSKIHSLPPMREDRLETIIDFAVSVQNFCSIVDACGLEEHIYNVSLLHQLVSKLPPTIKLDWARYRQSLPNVNLVTFSYWVYSLAEAASAVNIPAVQGPTSSRPDNRNSKKGTGFLNAHTETAPEKPIANSSSSQRSSNDGCVVCKSSCKSIEKCKQFLDLTRESRWAVVRDFGLCRRCLRKHFGGCNTKPCGRNGCTFKHHELLHNEQAAEKPKQKPEQKPNAESGNSSSSPGEPSTSQHGCNTHRTCTSAVLFRYLPVVIHGSKGIVQTFAFLDEGSALTLMDQEIADELGLDGNVSPLCLRWTGGTERYEQESKIMNVSLSGVQETAKRFKLDEVRTVKGLLLPHQSLNMEELRELYPHLRGLPVESYVNARPRILIGLKHAHVSLVLRSREGKLDQPIAVKTRLGWTVCGGGCDSNAPNMVHYSFHVRSNEANLAEDQTDESLHRAMKEYFSLDSFGVVKPNHLLLSNEDQRASSLLQSSTHFIGDRYETCLLWRHDDIRLPDSRNMALRRFNLLEKRMQKDPELGKILKEHMKDYLKKGYVRRLTPEQEAQPLARAWYLPIFPVVNPNKPGKVRIVWDAAATSFGKSLNSALLKGPDQLCSLFSILLQFRKHRIGLTGDIREMFHQICICLADQHCQRFFWRNDNGELEVYVMCVMTFGACCSPSSAQYVKNINAERFEADYPRAVEAIKNQHYVDDMLVSVESEEAAIRLAEEVKYVHAQGGFEIRNWVSNSAAVLKALGQTEANAKNLDIFSELATEKVLGLWWCTEQDAFTYKVNRTRYDEALLEGHRRPTKREVLRLLMTIFDPLGLIAHFLMLLKVLLQDIWRSGTLWDEEINDEAFAKWQSWLKVLPHVENVRVPRCFQMRTPAGCDEVQLHTFVDASEKGFAAACYLRFIHTTDQGSEVESILVAAKTRVAPLKFLSVPRLELQAAVLGTRLAQTVMESLSMQITSRYYWTDSQDVLAWINSDHRRYIQFVAFRVSEILDNTETCQWRWVPTKQNVADDATKWEKLPDLSVTSRWFNGPQFLSRPAEEWPQQQQRINPTSTELRPHLLGHVTASEPVIRLTDYSKWEKLVKVTAFVQRYVGNCRRRSQHIPARSGFLCMTELREAEEFVIRQTQREAFTDELANLQKNKQLPKSSPLFKFTPYLDDHSILRMRGRIAACVFATLDAKDPIILPRDHHATNLVIAAYHERFHHLNHEAVINELRQRYAIPRIRASYTKIRANCQLCKINRASPNAPIMADLPMARLAVFSRPFTHVGIDYFGPIEVVIGRRVEKRWGMLATCMTTRAMHIEVVHSLTTASCVMAIRNMIGRRGTPRHIYCDRGTNFVGTCKELKGVIEEHSHEAIMQEFVSSDTDWSFNPPASPHMGGSWERLIRSVKVNLMAIRPPHKMNDEVLRNALIEIENTLNSRPLTHVSIDNHDAPALTPNHILLGSSNGTKPLTVLEDDSCAVRQCWRTSQIAANQFWRRWLSDYLPELTRRTKWFTNTPSITIGDVVIIVDPKLPRNCWPKGRVIATRVGRDGKIRSATVRTVHGVYERPVVKLAILDVKREDM